MGARVPVVAVPGPVHEIAVHEKNGRSTTGFT
jgi:hypothetical protein